MILKSQAEEVTQEWAFWNGLLFQIYFDFKKEQLKCINQELAVETIFYLVSKLLGDYCFLQEKNTGTILLVEFYYDMF